MQQIAFRERGSFETHFFIRANHRARDFETHVFRKDGGSELLLVPSSITLNHQQKYVSAIQASKHVPTNEYKPARTILIMTSVPYPTFEQQTTEDRQALAAVGRCRIQPTKDDDALFAAIVAKCTEQGAVDTTTTETAAANKKLQKKYMKQAVALASDYLQQQQHKLDVSVIDVEIVLRSKDVVRTAGCLASCWLDAGCARIVLPYSDGDVLLAEAVAAARLPRERLLVHVDWRSMSMQLASHPGGDDDSDPASLLSTVFDRVRADADAVSVYVEHGSNNDDDNNATADDWPERLRSVLECSKREESLDVVVQFRPPPSAPSDNDDNDNVTALASLVRTLSQSTQSHTTQTTISLIDPTARQLGLCYAACLTTDRPDGLFPTVVCTRSGEALGLVYSSGDSIVAALASGRGVYYSRSRQSLWRKGDTSGHTQTLHRIDADCDGDALRFTVTQETPTAAGSNNAAFCHLNTLTCWGPPRGVRRLEETLRERLHAAPEGSYTKRLFHDRDLLRDKLVEEAQELAEAESATHVAQEWADLLYFGTVRAVQAGVTLDDAVAELDRRTRKVTRRPGDSKAFRIAAGQAILDQTKKAAANAKQEEGEEEEGQA